MKETPLDTTLKTLISSKRNSRGPSTLPWITLRVTGLKCEAKQLASNTIYLDERYNVNRESIGSLISIGFHLVCQPAVYRDRYHNTRDHQFTAGWYHVAEELRKPEHLKKSKHDKGCSEIKYAQSNHCREMDIKLESRWKKQIDFPRNIDST